MRASRFRTKQGVASWADKPCQGTYLRPIPGHSFKWGGLLDPPSRIQVVCVASRGVPAMLRYFALGPAPPCVLDLEERTQTVLVPWATGCRGTANATAAAARFASRICCAPHVRINLPSQLKLPQAPRPEAAAGCAAFLLLPSPSRTPVHTLLPLYSCTCTPSTRALQPKLSMQTIRPIKDLPHEHVWVIGLGEL